MIALTLAALLLSPQDRKLPAPDAMAQKEADKIVRETFKEEYAKKAPAARLALARKLLGQGVDTKDNDAASFVLLRESRDLASGAGDVALALQAISELARRFQVDGVEMKAATLAAAGKTARSTDEFASVAKAYLVLVEEALGSERYESAERAAAAGAGFAKKGKDLALFSRIDAKGKEAADLRGRLTKVQQAVEAIGKNADDAEAHLTLGKYLALVSGDWPEGLNHLARGSDSVFKAAAEKDLAKPSEALDRIATGDAWWELSEKDAGAYRARLRGRAAYWYLMARDQTAGLTRTRIDKRLELAGLLPPVRPSVDLLKLIDLRTDAVQGRWQVIDGKLVSPAVFYARVEVPYTPPEEYDLIAVVESEGKQECVALGLVVGDSRIVAIIDGWDSTQTKLQSIENQTEDEAVSKGKVLVSGQPNTIVCSVRKAKLTVSVNDKVVIDWVADYKRASVENVWATANSKALIVGSYLSIYRFSKLSLVPVTGEGKKLR